MSDPAVPERGVARRWYRSLYWRIAFGFVATVAVVLALQAALFLWLAATTRRARDAPPRPRGRRRRRRARRGARDAIPGSTSTPGCARVRAWPAPRLRRADRRSAASQRPLRAAPPFLPRLRPARLRRPVLATRIRAPRGRSVRRTRPRGRPRRPRPRRPSSSRGTDGGRRRRAAAAAGRSPLLARVRPDAGRGRPGAAGRRHGADGAPRLPAGAPAPAQPRAGGRARSAPARPRCARPRAAATKSPRWRAASTGWPPTSTRACRSCATPIARGASCSPTSRTS